jgi:hypothetical protein
METTHIDYSPDERQMLQMQAKMLPEAPAIDPVIAIGMEHVHQTTEEIVRDVRGNLVSPERAKDLRFQRISQPDGSRTDGLGNPIKTIFKF